MIDKPFPLDASFSIHTRAHQRLATPSPFGVGGEGARRLVPGRRVGDEGKDATAGSRVQFAARVPWRLSLNLGRNLRRTKLRRNAALAGVP
jgi:hypothetical protein